MHPSFAGINMEDIQMEGKLIILNSLIILML